MHLVSRMQLLKYIVQNVLYDIKIFWNDQLTDQPLSKPAFGIPAYFSGLQD